MHAMKVIAGVTAALVLSLGTPLAANAGYVVSIDAAPSFSGLPSARVRNGNTGFEAVLCTPANPCPAGVSMNPGGAPIWNNNGNTYGQTYFDFRFTWAASTGTATWGIDFTKDGDFLDAQELVTSVSPTLAGKGFDYVNLFMSGFSTTANPSGGVDIKDFTLNGTNFGSYSKSGAGNTNNLFEHNGGSYDIMATGNFTFTGDGGSELPRLWIQLGGPVDVPTQVPEPGSLALVALALVGLGAARRRKTA